MELYRIVKQEYAGSLYASGIANRWNKSGQKVIYTAGSRSLACLENVVHSSGEALQEKFTVMVIYVPDSLAIASLHISDLPEDWYRKARHLTCQQLGSEWYESMKTAVLKVPSAVVHEEYNFVLNSEHPQYNEIQIIDQKEFALDPRIKLEGD